MMNKKSGIVILTFLLISTLLTSCMSQTLSTHFVETDVEAEVRDVIDLINAQDTTGLRERCTVQLREALTDEVMAQIYEAIGEGGAFDSIQSISIGGRTDKATGEEFAVAVVNARYEIRRFVFTISLTRQMKLAGLYYK
ncbi:MAG: DUF3887 domain-containing protein [Eubacteriales bacterium]|jgi:hypothetical protein|nr:DUF3887 domain-containing protein [Eubacteriales bacterium]